MINKEEACDELLNQEKTLERLANPEPQKGETEETDGQSRATPLGNCPFS